MSSIPDVSIEVYQRPAPPSDAKRRREPTVVIHHLSATVDFGKHRGLTVEAILKRDPSWLFWAARNLPDFDLSPDAWKKLAEMI